MVLVGNFVAQHLTMPVTILVCVLHAFQKAKRRSSFTKHTQLLDGLLLSSLLTNLMLRYIWIWYFSGLCFVFQSQSKCALRTAACDFDPVSSLGAYTPQACFL